jgi:hypothetical protein
MAQLASMNRRLNKVDLLSEQLGNIKESMRNLTAENSLIKSTIASTQPPSTLFYSRQPDQDGPI